MSRDFDVVAPPDWSWAQEDGTFGNRFDDPGKYRGIPEEDRFRVVYCATQRAAAFGETIARFRRSPKLVERLRTIDDEEPFEAELEGGVLRAWSIRMLAQRAGVSTETIYSLEHGRREWAWPRTVRKLAEALEVEPKELVKGEVE